MSGEINVVFFGDGGNVFSNRHFHALRKTDVHIQAVVDAPKKKWKSTNTAAETDLDSFIEWGKRQEVPVITAEDPNDDETLRFLSGLGSDLYIAVGYNRLLKSELLSLPSIGAVNFHASLLPAYRGKHPLYWALQNNEALAGLSVHFMDAGLDTGDIIYQIHVETRKNDTVPELYIRSMDKSVGLMSRLIDDARTGELKGAPQDQFPWTPSYYSSLPGEDA